MQDHAEKITTIMQAGSYSISGGLLVGDWLAILDDHAAAFGVILGVLTFISSQIWQYLNHRAIKRQYND
ncbi:MAG: hypothetical protein ACXV8W_14935 [Methylobacter sp.]